MASETMGVLRAGGEPVCAALPRRNTRLSALSMEHDDLDLAIASLHEAGTYDDLLIARLKKRKLQIKDKIARAEAASAMPIKERTLIRMEVVSSDLMDVLRSKGEPAISVFPESGARFNTPKVKRDDSYSGFIALLLILVISLVTWWPLAILGVRAFGA
jgi:hypothetical protein